jgi:hypothetical protein
MDKNFRKLQAKIANGIEIINIEEPYAKKKDLTQNGKRLSHRNSEFLGSSGFDVRRIKLSVNSRFSVPKIFEFSNKPASGMTKKPAKDLQVVKHKFINNWLPIHHAATNANLEQIEAVLDQDPSKLFIFCKNTARFDIIYL